MTGGDINRVHGKVSFSYAYAQIYEDIIKDAFLARDGVKEPMLGPMYSY